MSSIITFHFTLKDADGTLIDSSYESNQPIQFSADNNELFPKALEEEIKSMAVGEKKAFQLTPTQAFGKRDEDKLIVIPINDIKLSHEGQQITKGQRVLLTRPDHEDTNEVWFTITGVMNGMVALDANHPLAGLTLAYEIEIV